MLGTVTWYVSRATGVIAYALLGASIVFGLMMSTRLSKGRPSIPWLLDVHRMMSGIAVVLVAVHVIAILADSFIDFGFTDVLVPFTIDWQPGGVAAGIVAMYLLIAVEVTSLLRNRLRPRTWRRIHYFGFLVFLLTSVHFLATGTDSSSVLSQVIIATFVVAVVALTTYRIVLAHRRSASPVAAAPTPRQPRPPAPLVTSRGGIAPPPRRTRLQHSGGHPAARRQSDLSDAGRHVRDHRDLHRGVRAHPAARGPSRG